MSVNPRAEQILPQRPQPPHLSKSRKKKTTAARMAMLIHSFIGLKLSIILTLVLASGTLSVFYEEIDWLLYSEKRVTPTGEKMNPGEVLDKLQAQFPESGISGFSTAVHRDRSSATALKSLPDGRTVVVHIDPYTAEVKGDTDFLTVGRFIRTLHGNLFMPVIGRAFVNFFGVLCLVGLVTGLIAYRRFWKKFFVLPRFKGVKFHRFLAELHKLVGLWSLWFVLIIGISGSWWFYQNPFVLYKLAPALVEPYPIEPGLTQSDLNNLIERPPQRLSSAQIVNAVKQHDPNFEIHNLIPPGHAGMAYTVRGTGHELLTNAWDGAYFIHPFTGEVLGDRLMDNMNFARRFDRAMKPLHYGSFGHAGWSDLLVKGIWFVFGLGMTILSVTGMVIYYDRTKSSTRRALQNTRSKHLRNLKKAWLVLRPWGGPMSGFKYLNWAFVVVMCVGISVGFTLQKEGMSNAGFQYVQKRIGNWDVSLNVTLGLLEKDLNPIAPGRRVNVNAFVKGNTKQIKFMYVNFKKPRTMRAPGFVIHGVSGNLHAHARVPKKLAESPKLWVTIEDWDGEFYQESWPLLPDNINTRDKRTY